MIEIRNIQKAYSMGENVVHALRGVSLTIEKGDFVAIMGPSGSGKSTLMHMLGLLDVPDQGSYKLNGREVSKLSDNELAILRREEVGFVFQQFNLLPRMTAQENVSLPLLYSKRNGDSSELSKGLLEQVGLEARILHRPNELSGGQQQRVAIARSLVNQPRVILADEPTGNLDSVSSQEIMTVLKKLNEQGITIIIVTHEEEIARFAKRLVRMRDGIIYSDERREPLSSLAITSSQQKPSRPQPWWLEMPEHFKQGLKTLAGNKIRTGLSMLGILIGVSAVVAMLALGHGAQKAIETQLSSLGSNLLMLRAGAVRGMGGAMIDAGAVTRLTAEDAHVIKEHISSVKEAAPSVMGRGQLTYLNKNWSTSILGVSSSYARMHNDMPVLGRFFTDEENKKRNRVAVIGPTIVREVFEGQNPIGEMIKINKSSFQVIGVLPEKGMMRFQDQDDRVLIPVFTAMRRVFGKDYIDVIDIEVTKPEYMDDVQEQTMELMFSRHRVPLSQNQDAFQIMNMADIQAALTASTKIMTLLLSVIAAISLLVGGIGIMNIMLVSVTERTREIGLRKAIGARRRDILLQFLAESVVISAVGGLAGIILGWMITLILSSVAGWTTSISPQSVFLAFFFSAFIGILFGSYPAQKASQLHPIDALRYE